MLLPSPWKIFALPWKKLRTCPELFEDGKEEKSETSFMSFVATTRTTAKNMKY
jgi:hypothetical protein